ncbi:MAG: Arc family DNA-binding protein [Planctomycetes bacterium]|nr:Arc family DNA-binding protein [Planctomycetota bacterium]
MANDKKGFLLRIPEELLEQLRGWAEQEMRSVNGQIEWILREALRARGRASGEAPPPARATRRRSRPD